MQQQLQPAEIRRLYYEEGMTQSAIARRFQCTRGKIRYWLGDERVTNDPLRYGSRPCVRIIHSPSGLFSVGAEFRMAALAFGAMPQKAGDNDRILYADGDDTVRFAPESSIGWEDGTVFAIGRPGNSVQATCIDGVIVREDGCVMQPNTSGGMKWVAPDP